jgi:hypothetical protein
MARFKQITAAVLVAASGVVAFATPAASSAFVAWRVSGVAAGDLLNVRAYPSSKSTVLIGYKNGHPLSMTGKCTGGDRLDEIQGPVRGQTAPGDPL